jgi:hypothetical protein
MSKRQIEEERRAEDKASGEDWQPYKRDGQIVPHTYINGQGKLKTEGYQPPEPPETDIPIPCIEYNLSDAIDALVYMLDALKAQTQTASQMEPENLNVGWKDGWIPHKPGDPMPCEMGTRIVTKTISGGGGFPHEAGPYNWDVIVAWKPAT